jgi:hypothetical protein
MKFKKYKHIRTGKWFNPVKDVMVDQNYWVEVEDNE